MYQKTLSFYIAMMYRSFTSFTSNRLQEAGLHFGLLFFILYIGKHPGCSPSQLTQSLALDWGHSQRCITQLTDKGFITKEKEGRHYVLNLTEQGKNAFSIAHQVFFDWDEDVLQTFTDEEKNQLFTLLEKATNEIARRNKNELRNRMYK